jgi:arginyl-tRNA synthetase
MGTVMEQNIFAAMRARVIEALRGVVPDLPDEVAARVEVAPPRDPAHGEAATNAALVVAKVARRKPQEIAVALAAALAADPTIAEATPAGPGFINLRLRPEAWRGLLPVILAAGERYGGSAAGAGVRINVEYVSANPTGPMHIGHCRGAVVGDALANLLAKVGHPVTKEFYVNDAGNQVTALAWAAYFRYLQALGTPIEESDFARLVPGGLQYRGDYLIPIGEALKQTFGEALATPSGSPDAVDKWLEPVRDFTVAAMIEQIKADLASLGVVHDIFVHERSLLDQGKVDDAIGQLQHKDLVYEGILEPPKGKAIDDWEPREQLLFRATKFGDDVDRPLKKSDGSFTYFASDIAYHADKMARGADLMIDVWGADHGGYVRRMQAATRALGGTLDVVLCQIVHVLKDGKPLRMSKRAGTYVTLADLIEEVGPDAVRFTMLTRKSDAQMEFDIDQAVAETRENPVFYVQYAHARCRSVLRAAAESLGEAAVSPAALAQADLTSLTDEAELSLLRRLGGWPRGVQAAAQAREPHRIAFFLYDLAADFHMLWHRGRDAAAMRFLQAGRPVETLARVALVAATAMVIRSGLAVMGVTPVEEMR